MPKTFFTSKLSWYTSRRTSGISSRMILNVQILRDKSCTTVGRNWIKALRRAEIRSNGWSVWRFEKNCANIVRYLFRLAENLKERYWYPFLLDSALVQVSQIFALSPPAQSNLDVLHEWLERPKYGKGFLKGVESQTWDLEKGRADYVTLSNKQVEQDILTRWIYKLVPGTLHQCCGHRFKKAVENIDAGDDLFEYNDSHLSRTAHTLSSALSSLLPTISIFALYYVKNMPARLGLIMAFTTMFAAILELVSNARRAEVFAITTALVK